MIDRENVQYWMNAIGLIISALPESYWKILFTEIVSEFQNSSYLNGQSESTKINPFEVFISCT